MNFVVMARRGDEWDPRSNMRSDLLPIHEFDAESTEVAKQIAAPILESFLRKSGWELNPAGGWIVLENGQYKEAGPWSKGYIIGEILEKEKRQ